MKNAIKPLTIGLVCFFSGYQFATFTQSPASIPSIEQRVSSKDTILTNKYSQHRDEPRSAHIAKHGSFDLKKTRSDNKPKNESSTSDLSEELIKDDIDAMLMSIEALKSERGNGQLIATQYDLLKKYLIENPDKLENVVLELDSHSVNSDSFDTLLSLIHTLPSEKTSDALHSLAEQYAGAFDKDSQNKLLTVLSNTPTPIESEYIKQSLVDLVIFEQTDVNTKLRALNLVKPSQLHQTEKADISKELKQLMSTSNDQEAAQLLPQLMRFSNKAQRSGMARDLLSQNGSEPIRSAILDDIDSGTIPTTDDLKMILLEIARNPEDSLSSEAAATLEYSFELGKQEHARLKSYR